MNRNNTNFFSCFFSTNGDFTQTILIIYSSSLMRVLRLRSYTRDYLFMLTCKSVIGHIRDCVGISVTQMSEQQAPVDPDCADC